MERNNGKIAIAIVAMFVVVLSVVGFTYAYFTARVEGNGAAKSVEVQAGRLEIVYSNGTRILAQNLVPGWVSDGDHFYDEVYSKQVDAQGNEVKDEAGNYKIVAVTKTDCASKKSDGQAPDEGDGITAPAVFKVSNSEENTADNKYIIRLTNIVNGLDAADQKNFWITLYNTDGESETVVWSGNLAATTSVGGYQIIVPEAITLNADTEDDTFEHNYKIVATYANVDSEQNSKNAGISADVEVIGVALNEAGELVDADGHVLDDEFPEANTNAPSNGLDGVLTGCSAVAGS